MDFVNTRMAMSYNTCNGLYPSSCVCIHWNVKGYFKDETTEAQRG